MLRHAARILLVAALMVSIGLHWAVLQSAAWAGMIVRYSVQEGSLITGISQTFDNEHPCTLCGAVQQGSKNEKAPAKRADNEKKLVLVLEAPDRPVLAPPPPCLLRADAGMSALQRSVRPPVPPPRRG